MFITSKNKGKGLFRYRTLNNSDVEQLEKSRKKEKEQTSNRGKIPKEEKESCSESFGESEKKKKKKRVCDLSGKENNDHRDSNSDHHELDVEYLEKLLDEEDDIVTPKTWKYIDTFFAWVIILLKFGILITLICISCDQDGKGCLACSTCKNEEYEMDSLPLVGSIFKKN